MPEPRAWEKACPICEYGFVAVVVNGMSCDMHCPHCHGTGVVPMTTSEMLEALADSSKHVTHSVHLSYNPLRQEAGRWLANVYGSNSRAAVARYARTPDDALRAALEGAT